MQKYLKNIMRNWIKIISIFFVIYFFVLIKMGATQSSPVPQKTVKRGRSRSRSASPKRKATLVDPRSPKSSRTPVERKKSKSRSRSKGRKY